MYRDGTLVHTSTNASTRSFTDTGLTNNTTYSYRVSAVNSVGEGAKSTAVSVISGTPRPDAQIGLVKTGPFQGDNEYATSVTPTQTLQQNVARGGTATYHVPVQNDRPAVDSLTVKAVESGSSGYTVKYYLGTTNITSQVLAGTYKIADLAPGASVVLKVKVTATSSAAVGSSRNATVTVKSATTTSIKDIVRARAVRT